MLLIDAFGVYAAFLTKAEQHLGPQESDEKKI